MSWRSVVAVSSTVALQAVCGFGAGAVAGVEGSRSRVVLALVLGLAIAAFGRIDRLLRPPAEESVPRFAGVPVTNEWFVVAAFDELRRRAMAPWLYLNAILVVAAVGGLMSWAQRPDPVVAPLLALGLAMAVAVMLQWGRLEREVTLLWRLRRLRDRSLEERLEALPELAAAFPRDVTAVLIRHRVEKETGSKARK